MGRKIFKDDEFESRFNEHGFVNLKLFDRAQCDKLVELYQDLDNVEFSGGFYTTMQNPDREKKKIVSDALSETMNDYVSFHLIDFVPLFANFLIKRPKNKHQVGIHQDWNYVDEGRHRSVNVWVALRNTTTRSGGLFILPGSHQFDLPIRSTPFDSKLYDKYRRQIIKNSVGIDLPMGHAVMYDSALIHYSRKNRSDSTRYACAGVFIPKEATPKYYYKRGKWVYEYDVDSDFYWHVDPDRYPGDHYSKCFESQAGKRELPFSKNVLDYIKRKF